MMRIATVILLSASMAQATQDQVEDLADQLVDKLIDKLFGMAARPAISARPIASPLAGYRPQCQATVRDMQQTLKSYGVASSPMQKMALTALAGTRDVCMAAQVRNQLESLDAKDKMAVVAAEAAVESKAKDMAGVTAPFQSPWDPWGLSTDVDEGELLFYREIELKHGRIGMLATLGLVMGEKFSAVFGDPNPSVPAAFAVERTTNALFWPAVLIAISNIEIATIENFGSIDRFSAKAKKEGWTMTSGRIPGDFGWDPLGLKPKDSAKLLDLQNKELNNGRLAMLAAAGIIAQELANGKKVF